VHRPRLLGTLVFVALGGLVAAGCGSSPPPTASSIIHGLPSALAGRSVHFVEVTKSGKDSDTLTADLSPKDASVRVVQGKAEFDLVRVGKTIYARTNAPSILENQVGLSSKVADETLGKWVSIHTADAPYRKLNSDLNLVDQVGVLTPVKPGLRLGPQTNVRAVATLPVAGTPPSGTLDGGTGSMTLFVSPDAPHLPLGATVDLQTGKQREAIAAAFTRWGERVREAAPASSVTYWSVFNA
jgi:hypothetical protein